MAINALLGGLAGGGAIVYLAPRFNFFLLALPSYVWSFVSTVIGTYAMDYLGLIPDGMKYHVLMLSLISSVNQLHLNALLGYERVRAFNMLALLQAFLLTVSLVFFAVTCDNFMAFVFAMYISQLAVLLTGFVLLWKRLTFEDLAGLGDTIPEMLRLGFFVQVANVVQLFNYRLVYYLIDLQLGRAMLGVFDMGTKLSEGVWMTGKSVATVQYSVLANEKNNETSVAMTLRLFRFTILLSFLAMAALVVIPESVYLWFFSAEFSGLKRILWFLSPGILAISGGMIVSHYFAGRGLHRINTFGSLIGLGVLALSALFLIPAFDLTGAAIAVTLGYLSSFVFGLLMFRRSNAFLFSEMVPRLADFRMFFIMMSKMLKTKS